MRIPVDRRRCCSLLQSALLLVLAAYPARGANHRVNDAGTGDFPSIQAAVNAAQPGDIIEITDGTYYESIDLSAMADPRDLELRRYGGLPLIQSSTGPALYASAGFSGRLVINHLAFSTSLAGSDGIAISSVSGGVYITDCTFDNVANCGVSVMSSTGIVEIDNCTFLACGGNGVDIGADSGTLRVWLDTTAFPAGFTGADAIHVSASGTATCGVVSSSCTFYGCADDGIEARSAGQATLSLWCDSNGMESIGDSSIELMSSDTSTLAAHLSYNHTDSPGYAAIACLAGDQSTMRIVAAYNTVANATAKGFVFSGSSDTVTGSDLHVNLRDNDFNAVSEEVLLVEAQGASRHYILFDSSTCTDVATSGSTAAVLVDDTDAADATVVDLDIVNVYISGNTGDAFSLRQQGAGVFRLHDRGGASATVADAIDANNSGTPVTAVGSIVLETLASEFTANQPVSIGRNVWDDVDRDGINDMSEPGVSRIELAELSQGILSRTAGNGMYVLPAFLPGTYTVSVLLPSTTYRPTTQDAGADDAVDSDFSTTGAEAVVTVLPAAIDETVDCGLIINYAPSLVALTSQLADENSAPGTVIGTLSATDPDAEDAHTFSIVDDGGGRFAVVGNELRVGSGAGLDYETDALHSITVRATDDGVTPLHLDFPLEISLSDVNEAPTDITLSSASIDENSPAGTRVGLLGATDPDFIDLHVYELLDDASGRFQIFNVDLQVADPALFDHEAADSHSVTVRVTDLDGAGLSYEEVFTIAVNDVNEDPTANNDTGATSEDLDADLVVLADDTDPDDGDVLSVLSVGVGGTHGFVTINGDDTINYDPIAYYQYLAEGESAVDTFTYTAQDTAGLTDTASVTVTVTGVNDAPQALPDVWETDEDTLLVSGLASVLDNDMDPDLNDTRTVTASDTASGSGAAVAVAADGTFQYDPAGIDALQGLHESEMRMDTFFYTMADGHGVSDSAQVLITVWGVEDAPVAYDDAATTDQDNTVYIPDVLQNDTDPDASETRRVAGVNVSATLGLLSNHGDGTFEYDPNGQFDHLDLGQSATDSFTYDVADSTDLTDTATVTITITGLNDNPDAVDDAVSGWETTEDALLTVSVESVLDNDTDPDASAVLTVNGGSASSASGAAVSMAPDGTFTYDPTGVASLQALASGDSVTDTFAYTVSDGLGGTDAATVTITIAGVNDAPTASDDAAATDEDTPIAVIDVLANDFDIDAGDVVSVDSIDTVGTLGLVADNGDGTFAYDPHGAFEYLSDGEIALDSFTYTATDVDGLTATATVTITVTGVTDASPPPPRDDGDDGCAPGAGGSASWMVWLALTGLWTCARGRRSGARVRG
jgi:VCBS repeat-containing protein